MIEMIGAGSANTILGLDVALSSTKLQAYLKERGVQPIGIDAQKNMKWNKADVLAVHERNMEAKRAEAERTKAKEKPAVPVIENPSLNYSTAVKVAELQRTIDALLLQSEDVFQVLRNIDAAIKAPTTSDINDVALSELKDTVVAFMADQQRQLANQIDSALTGMDKKIGHIQTSIQGHGKVLVDNKTRQDEILRVVNSIMSNVYQTQKDTREEIVGALNKLIRGKGAVN